MLSSAFFTWSDTARDTITICLSFRDEVRLFDDEGEHRLKVPPKERRQVPVIFPGRPNNFVIAVSRDFDSEPFSRFVHTEKSL